MQYHATALTYIIGTSSSIFDVPVPVTTAAPGLNILTFEFCASYSNADDSHIVIVALVFLVYTEVDVPTGMSEW